MSVSQWGISVTRPNLHFFRYIKAYKPFADSVPPKPSSSNLYWPSTSQYRHILIQCHQVPLIIHHLVRHRSADWIISLFTTHLMSHAQYTWSSCYFLPPQTVQWTCWLFLASDRYKSRGSAGRARKMKDKKDNGRLGITRIWRELENPRPWQWWWTRCW